MKLFRFGEKDYEKPAVEIDGVKKDFSAYFVDWNREFFNDNGIEKLREIVTAGFYDLADVPADHRFGSCVARPGNLICIGLNYSDHAAESGLEPPSEPVVFLKATNTVTGPFDEITIPKNSEKTDWEVELGIVIGKDSLYLASPDDAKDRIAGYCISQDVSERAFQIERGGQWTKGKSCPNFNPIGPYLVPESEIDDVNDLSMKLKVNGDLRQNGNTKNMIFDPYFIVHYLSQFMLLEAGDVITTGTPAGVGLGMDAPQFLKDGDVVELSIEKLGSQKQTFKSYRG